MVEDGIEFLKDLQEQMRYEDEFDNDMQASPRFWVLRDMKTVPTHEDFADRIEYFYNDGDLVKFRNVHELYEFLMEMYEDSLMDSVKESIEEIVAEEDFYELWDLTLLFFNKDEYFNELPVEDEWFIVPDTMFLTKEEAKSHIEGNRHHYTSKVHTYAMTAWRAPKVGKLLDILMNMNWDELEMGVD